MVTQEELEKMSPEEIAELQKQNCIFCKIISGQIPGAKIFESKLTESILDINPASKGHAIVLPKEHYPILPLVPPETFKQMFLDAKVISTSIKEATLAGSAAIFIANGALAGQQAPHFLFHIIPDHKFSFNPNPSMKEKNDALAEPLKNNLTIMMGNHAKREGLAPTQGTLSPRAPSPNNVPSQVASPSPEDLAKRREQIAKIIDENSDVRNLLRSDVESFKKTIEGNEQLKQIFEGVDLRALSKNLESYPEESASPSPSSPTASSPIESPKQDSISTEENISKEALETSSSIQTPAPSAVSAYANNSTLKSESIPSSKPKPEVFLGHDPLAQKDKVFAYFDEKPKAKELLISDVEKFKKLLSARPDIQPIFDQVNVDKLSEKLNKITKGDSHN